MESKKSILLGVLFFFGVLSSFGQTYLYFAKANETLFDSTCKKKIRPLSKGECFLVETDKHYKREYIYVICVADGKKGFVHYNHLKKEKLYSTDSAGANLLETAKKEYATPFARFKNTEKKAVIKLFFNNRNYILNPGETQEFTGLKPGKQHFKMQTPGYQPLYTEEDFEPYHIVEIELYL